MIGGSGGSKSRLAKAAGAEPAGQMRDEKLHAVVARSTFASQNVQSTPLSDHFWQLRCRKSARRCGAKHISKSKCTKHTRGLGPLLEVETSKKCTPLWREAHFEVKMYKTHHSPDHFWKLRCRKSARRCGAKHISKSKCYKTLQGSRPLLEVQISKKCTPLWHEAHFQVKMYKAPRGPRPLLEVQMSKKCTPLWREAHFEVKTYKTLGCSRPLLEVQMSKKCTPLWHYSYITLHSTTLHYTTATLHVHNTFTTIHILHSTTLQRHFRYTKSHYIYTTLHYTPLHYTTLHYTTLPSTTLHYITPHYTPDTLQTTQTTLHYNTLHYTKLHYTTLHYTTLQVHYTTLHYTTFCYTSLHYTPLHYNYNYEIHRLHSTDSPLH